MREFHRYTRVCDSRRLLYQGYTHLLILDTQRSLEHIDRQHSVSFAKDLKMLGQYTKKVTLQPGQVLYEDIKLDRGLFFIEYGIVKVERNADETLTRKGNGDTFSRNATNSWGSLNHLRATDVTRAIAEMKAKGNRSWERRSFRVARVGPGWVLGQNEALSDVANPGVSIAGRFSARQYKRSMRQGFSRFFVFFLNTAQFPSANCITFPTRNSTRSRLVIRSSS